MSSASALDAPLARNLRYSSASLWVISICFILSGATGLIYEVLWARMLGLVFGATTFAISTVLAAFMGGLALGSALAGRMGARIKRPLRAYGVIEIAIALYALFVPLLFGLIDQLYALIWTEFRPGFYAFSLWRFVLSCAALLVPTALMGATLPVLSAALLVRSRSRASNAVARLYTCNLIGAILGTLAAGFVLLPLVGLRATIWTAALINIAVGVVSIIADRSEGRAAATEERKDKEEPDAIEASGRLSEENEGRAIDALRFGSKRFWLVVAAVSGFVTISTQVAWTRVLTMIIGSSTYAFSLVVALFLLGLALGAYVVGRTALARRLRGALMTVELLTGASILLSVWFINKAPGLLFYQGTRLGVNSWTGLLALQGATAALIVFIPALLMGMVMPLVLVWAESGGRETGVKLVGRSYAVNTLGAIVGAFLTGFLFIPKIGTRFTILFAGWLCLMVAGLAYRPMLGKLDTVLIRRIVAVAAAIVLPLVVFRFVPRLNSADLSIGVYDRLARGLAHTQGSAAGGEGRVFSPQTNRVLMYEEGPTATVTVREDWGITSMAINGRTNASDNFARDGDMATQVMVGQLPLLVAPRTDTALIVGYASGVSVGSMLQSGLQSLECVELEPVTVKAAEKFFEHVNNRPTDDARLRLIIDDARTYLRVAPDRYDIIVSEPSHPWVPGVANLFTKEFFELGGARLRDDGVFVQWVQIYQLSTDSLRSVLATYESVFPHVMMFRVGGASEGKDLILVGSRAPLSLDRVEERMRDPRVKAELERIGVRTLQDVEAWYVCDERELGPAVAGAPLNTDDNMRIENRAPREAFLPLMPANSAWIEKLAAAGRERLLKPGQ
ncbi:MAG TPA: fused MFS/spermidine synthase [Pyrinomonadaceae bacterium]|nr:fused MFS/spermidine synthase [Pyrinomonadaceae bacterium]